MPSGPSRDSVVKYRDDSRVRRTMTTISSSKTVPCTRLMPFIRRQASRGVYGRESNYLTASASLMRYKAHSRS